MSDTSKSHIAGGGPSIWWHLKDRTRCEHGWATQKNGKRDYKHAYELQKKTGEVKDQLERQKARRMYDKAGIKRKGMDIDHIKKIKFGGKSVKSNLRLRSKHANESDNTH